MLRSLLEKRENAGLTILWQNPQTLIIGGEGGIRTLETLLGPTRFPVVRARPTTRLLHVLVVNHKAVSHIVFRRRQHSLSPPCKDTTEAQKSQYCFGPPAPGSAWELLRTYAARRCMNYCRVSAVRRRLCKGKLRQGLFCASISYKIC
jgi:hypothetical protein